MAMTDHKRVPREPVAWCTGFGGRNIVKWTKQDEATGWIPLYAAPTTDELTAEMIKAGEDALLAYALTKHSLVAAIYRAMHDAAPKINEGGQAPCESTESCASAPVKAPDVQAAESVTQPAPPSPDTLREYARQCAECGHPLSTADDYCPECARLGFGLRFAPTPVPPSPDLVDLLREPRGCNEVCNAECRQAADAIERLTADVTRWQEVCKEDARERDALRAENEALRFENESLAERLTSTVSRGTRIRNMIDAALNIDATCRDASSEGAVKYALARIKELTAENETLRALLREAWNVVDGNAPVCPSAWRTAEGRPHTELCVRIRAAIDTAGEK